MLFLTLSEPMIVDGSFPVAVRVAGLQAGDGVEVVYGPTAAPRTWHPRMGPLPWVRATATPGEFMLDPGQLPEQATFVATMAGHRAVGATAAQMGGTGQSWSHPGATARAGERWSFLTLAATAESGRVTITARDEPANRTRGGTGGIAGAETMSAVVDLSASMAPAAADGRLVTALAAVQASAARSRLTAVTVVFVGGDAVKRVVLPVKAPVAEAIDLVIRETGWRTGTTTDLTAALTPVATRSTDPAVEVVWVISDAAPADPVAAGRRLGYVLTGPAPSDRPDRPGVVHLSAGESVADLSDRMVGAVTG